MELRFKQVITNVALLGVCTSMLCLQRLCYGPLRPIEVEQLYEKAWFAITETCLAMTIFREEVGPWFLVMFVCLLVGKVWGWIGEGRVEILEQQPPLNPRLFHARLSLSLIISTLLDIFMLHYSTNTVLRHARPNMMVMFAFEFAVLTVTSLSTAARYTISIYEANVIKTQIKDRRAQIRRERESAQSSAAATASTDATFSDNFPSSASSEDDIDALDIDVSGWEEKGRWVFYLNLTTGTSEMTMYPYLSANRPVIDFLKLILYLTFFCVLCIFYGMPIHIIRDVALTIRSFYKRITDFVRYRQATKDMNARYPDATQEEVTHEDVCIICREDMRSWQQQTSTQALQPDVAGGEDTRPPAIDERLRPKKLPCGHILHFACLRSWLERQQNCPTCRRSVLVLGTGVRAQEPGSAYQHGREPRLPVRPQAQAHAHAPAQGNPQQPIAAQNVFNIGPLRIAFGARQGFPGAPQQADNDPAVQGHQPPSSNARQTPQFANALESQRQAPVPQMRTTANFNPSGLQSQFYQIEQHLIREINGLRIQQNQLNLVRALQGELARLRIMHPNPDLVVTGLHPAPGQIVEAPAQNSQFGQSFGSTARRQSMGRSHPDLPLGMTIPPGWTVLPLQRLPGHMNARTNATNGVETTISRPRRTSGEISAESLPTETALRTAANALETASPENHPSSPGLSTIGHSNDIASTRSTVNGSMPVTTGNFDSPSEDPIHASGADEFLKPDGRMQQPRDVKASASNALEPEMLDWSSGVQSPDVGQDELSNVEHTRNNSLIEGDLSSDAREAGSQTSTQHTQTKGKGKASMVEDVEEVD